MSGGRSFQSLMVLTKKLCFRWSPVDPILTNLLGWYCRVVLVGFCKYGGNGMATFWWVILWKTSRRDVLRLSSKPKINKYNSSQYIFKYPYLRDFSTGNCNFINKRPQLLWLIFTIYTMYIKQSLILINCNGNIFSCDTSLCTSDKVLLTIQD